MGLGSVRRANHHPLIVCPPPLIFSLVQRAYEAFQTEDMDMLRSVLAGDVSWHSRGSGERHGVDDVIAEFGRLFQDSGDTSRVTVNEIMKGDESVVVLARATGRPCWRHDLRSWRRKHPLASVRGISVCAPPRRRNAGPMSRSGARAQWPHPRTRARPTSRRSGRRCREAWPRSRCGHTNRLESR